MSILPKAVKEILEEGRSNIDPRGELSPSFRGKLYKIINNFCGSPSQNAHLIRARLELNCAWKVLENWEACELTNDSARKILEMAEEFLRGECDKKTLETTKNFFYTEVENLMNNGQEYFIAAYAGFACISAVNTVLYDVTLDTLGKPDIEIDPDYWTACFSACLSYCGGATWEEGVGDDLKRREFWEWFLNDAVPALWQI
ncbi:MAG: Imm5 family immunity protein [Microcoleus sp.]